MSLAALVALLSFTGLSFGEGPSETITAGVTTKIACWSGTDDGFVGRERPRACNIVRQEGGDPGAHNTYVIRRIKWRRWGKRTATGRGIFYPSHAEPKRIRLRLSRRYRCGPGRRTYLRVTMKTRDSTIRGHMALPPGCYYD